MCTCLLWGGVCLGPRRCLLDASVLLDAERLSGSMHVGEPVRFPFRLCLFL